MTAPAPVRPDGTRAADIERVCEAPVERLRELAGELAHGAATLAWLRLAAHGGELAPLRRALHPRGTACPCELPAVTTVAEYLARMLDVLRAGADAPALLRTAAAALDDARASELARELIDVALLLAPERREYELTRALIRMSLGDVDAVDASIRALRDAAPADASYLATYRDALFPTWAFWPATDSRIRVAERIAPLLPAVPPEQIATARAIQETATRLHVFRARLLERFGDQLWIVPSVTHLLPEGRLAEVAISDDVQGIAVQHLARRDWQRLGILCWLAGLDGFALPAGSKVPRQSLPLRLVCLARLALLAGDEPDLAHTLRDVVHPDRAAAVSAVIATFARETTWFGASIVTLPDALAELAIADELGLV
jgi:hypothetical protein